MPDIDSMRMYSVAEVVKRHGFTEYAVRQAIRTGELGHRRRGRTIYIPGHALETYIKDVSVFSETQQ